MLVPLSSQYDPYKETYFTRDFQEKKIFMLRELWDWLRIKSSCSHREIKTIMGRAKTTLMAPEIADETQLFLALVDLCPKLAAPSVKEEDAKKKRLSIVKAKVIKLYYEHPELIPYFEALFSSDQLPSDREVQEYGNSTRSAIFKVIFAILPAKRKDRHRLVCQIATGAILVLVSVWINYSGSR